MKIKIFLAAFICIISVNAFSQGFSFGLKGGAVTNKISGQSFSSKFTYGYQAGVFANIGISHKLSIQPEVLFNQVNVDTTSKFSDIYSFNKLNNISLKYLTVPVLLNYKFTKHITLQAGPQYGILMNQSNTLLQNGQQAFKNGDFSMVAGVQVRLLGLNLYGRYVAGMSNINDISNSDKWTNQSYQFGLRLVL